MRRLSLLLALLGVALAAALVLRFDAAEIGRAVLSVGWSGAAILLAWQALLFTLLGLAWWTIQPRLPPTLLIWGRMVRDAATACLPFSPVGGYVLGARAVTLRGPDWTEAAAGTVVDVAAELTAQLLFTLAGLALLVALRPGFVSNSGLAAPIAVAVLLVLALAALAVAARRRIADLLQALAARLLGDRTRADADRLRLEMARLAARPPSLLLGAALHFAGWCATGAGTFISLRLLGHPIPLLDALALEALLDAAIAVAFVVPAAAGVQEAGYLGLGAAFGVPPDLALSISLLRRAREITWGAPILAAWQLQELRRL